VRFTIERIRTVVLAAGVLLVIALGVFLARGTWKNPFKNRDIPKRLGVDIQQEANSFTYTQSRGGRTLFKLHASKVVQLKNNQAVLHDVKIELYGTDGGRVDRIEGSEFEYDQEAQIARAAGAVSITMMRPGTMPAVAADAGVKNPGKEPADGDGAGGSGNSGEIHVKTRGLVFYQKTGVATTKERVDFEITQGTGNAIGATYDSERGSLVLDQQVELDVKRNGEPVEVHAQHAEFERGDLICHMRFASAKYRDGDATAGAAAILFRDDGTAVRLDATDGFTMTTATGGRLAAPVGWLEFNENNQPKHGHLDGGVTLDSEGNTENKERQSHGTAPTADLEFSSDGELRHAHLERGVELASVEHSAGKDGPLTVNRKWRSLVADVEFRNAGGQQVEPAWLHGTGGVVVTGESQRGSGPVAPSRLTADDMKVDFGPGSTLSELNGVGHASIEETTSEGAHRTSSGDRLEAHFAAPAAGNASAPAKSTGMGGAQIEKATLEGNVTMTRQMAAKPGGAAEAPMRATAGRADYEGAGERIHLTVNPRVEDGGLQLTAEKIDVSQATGDAFAHGNVKATWINAGSDKPAQGSRGASGPTGEGQLGLGGEGPSHVVAEEAQMNQATGEATFRRNARLWQEANSVSAPVIVLNRQRQALTATSTDPVDPVRVVLLSASAGMPGQERSQTQSKADSRASAPTVIRMSGGVLKYSDARRRALMVAGAVGAVVAQTATARSVSDEVELILLPRGNHAGRNGSEAQVDKMTASGRVTVTSEGRQGTGNQLVYTGETGEYVLTGTPAAPPKMTDPTRGSVTGEALIFHGGDDSVSIEGGGRKTATETRTPK
jgi:lipopolysaccharide export system protein LptA